MNPLSRIRKIATYIILQEKKNSLLEEPINDNFPSQYINKYKNLIFFLYFFCVDDSSETPPLAGGYTSDFFENAGNVGVIAAAGNIPNANNIVPSPTSLEPSLSEVAVERAVSWLRSQRSQDWGWYNDTPNVLLALQLAAYTELNQIPEATLETQLSTKQMEIEILIMLWRYV